MLNNFIIIARFQFFYLFEDKNKLHVSTHKLNYYDHERSVFIIESILLLLRDSVGIGTDSDSDSVISSSINLSLLLIAAIWRSRFSFFLIASNWAACLSLSNKEGGGLSADDLGRGPYPGGVGVHFRGFIRWRRSKNSSENKWRSSSHESRTRSIASVWSAYFLMARIAAVSSGGGGDGGPATENK